MKGSERKFTLLFGPRNNEEIIQIDDDSMKPFLTNHAPDTLRKAMKDARRSPSPKTKTCVILIIGMGIPEKVHFNPVAG